MSRQYRFDDRGGDNSIAKLWNQGMGRLTFVVLVEEERKVLVNSTIARKRDYERIAEVFPEYEIVDVTYGYPTYYYHSMWYVYQHYMKAMEVS